MSLNVCLWFPSPAAQGSVKGSGHRGQTPHQTMWLETYKRGRACQETAERSLGGRLWGDVMAKANVMTEPGAGGPSAWVRSVLWYNFLPSSDFPGILVPTVAATEAARTDQCPANNVLVVIATVSHPSDATLFEADRIPRASQMWIWWRPCSEEPPSPLHCCNFHASKKGGRRTQMLQGSGLCEPRRGGRMRGVESRHVLVDCASKG